MKAKVAAMAESEKKGGGKLENEDLNSVDICFHFEFCQFVKFLYFMDFMRRIAKNNEKICKRHQITARIYYQLLTLFQFRL